MRTLVPSVGMGKITPCLDQEVTMREIRAIKDELKSNTTQSSIKLLHASNAQMSQDELTRNKTMLFVRSSQTLPPTTSLASTTNPFSLSNRVRVGDQGTYNYYADERKPIHSSRTTTSTTPQMRPLPIVPSTMGTPNTTSQPQSIYFPWHARFPLYTPAWSTPTTTQSRVRAKRFLPALIAIGTGIVSPAISAVNSVQMMNLKAEMRGVKESLRALHLTTLDHHAQIIHLNEGQFKLAQELGATQIALNKTIDLVSQHSDILRLHATTLKAMISQTMLLRDKLATATQAMESHFIHESIEDILSNKLTQSDKQ